MAISGLVALTFASEADAATLQVKSRFLNGTANTGLFIEIRNSTTLSVIATGFTPANFTITDNKNVNVGMGDFSNWYFHRWQDNLSTVQPRTYNVTTGLTTLTGEYRITSEVPVSFAMKSGHTTPEGDSQNFTISCSGQAELTSSTSNDVNPASSSIYCTNGTTVTVSAPSAADVRFRFSDNSAQKTFPACSSGTPICTTQAYTDIHRQIRENFYPYGVNAVHTVELIRTQASTSSAENMTGSTNNNVWADMGTSVTVSKATTVTTGERYRNYALQLDPSSLVPSSSNATTIYNIALNQTDASRGLCSNCGSTIFAERADTGSALIGKVINKIGVYLRSEGTVTGTVYIGVFNSTGHLKQQFGTYSASAISTSATLYNATLSSGSTYTIVAQDRIGVKYDGGSGSNLIRAWERTNNPYDGTASYRGRWNGTAWVSLTNGDVQAMFSQVHEPSFANDNSLTSYWTNNQNSESAAYIYADLGSAKSITGVRLYHPSTSYIPSTINIYLSNTTTFGAAARSGVSLTEVADWQTIYLDQATYRYVKLEVATWGSDVRWRVGEFEVLNQRSTPSSDYSFTISAAGTEKPYYQHEFSIQPAVHETHLGDTFTPMPSTTFTIDSLVTSNRTTLSSLSLTSQIADDTTATATSYWTINGTLTWTNAKWQGLVANATATTTLTSTTAQIESASRHLGILDSARHFRLLVGSGTINNNSVVFNENTATMTFDATASGAQTGKVEFLTSLYDDVKSVSFDGTPLATTSYSVSKDGSTGLGILTISGQTWSTHTVVIEFFVTSGGGGGGGGGGGPSGGGGGSSTPVVPVPDIQSPTVGSALGIKVMVPVYHMPAGGSQTLNMTIQWQGNTMIRIDEVTFRSNANWYKVEAPLPATLILAPGSNVTEATLPLKVTLPEQVRGSEIITDMTVKASTGPTVATVVVPVKVVVGAPTNNLAFIMTAAAFGAVIVGVAVKGARNKRIT